MKLGPDQWACGFLVLGMKNTLLLQVKSVHQTEGTPRFSHRCHILETGNDSYHFKASSKITKQKQKETPTLTTS
jgi:hypothetical protein